MKIWTSWFAWHYGAFWINWIASHFQRSPSCLQEKQIDGFLSVFLFTCQFGSYAFFFLFFFFFSTQSYIGKVKANRYLFSLPKKTNNYLYFMTSKLLWSILFPICFQPQTQILLYLLFYGKYCFRISFFVLLLIFCSSILLIPHSFTIIFSSFWRTVPMAV